MSVIERRHWLENLAHRGACGVRARGHAAGPAQADLEDDGAVTLSFLTIGFGKF